MGTIAAGSARWGTAAGSVLPAIALSLSPLYLNSLVMQSGVTGPVSLLAALLVAVALYDGWGPVTATAVLFVGLAFGEWVWTGFLLACVLGLALIAAGQRFVPAGIHPGLSSRLAAGSGVLITQLLYFRLDVPGRPALCAAAVLVVLEAARLVAPRWILSVDRRLDGAIAHSRPWLARHRRRLSRVHVPLLVGLAGAMAGWIAWVLRRDTFYDDAAITMRYATRIAEGDGFTYNDGDRTNGASAPLYTLLLAAGGWLGIGIPSLVQGVAVSSFAVVHGAVAWIGHRLAGLAAGALAAGLLILNDDFSVQALSGMESGFAAALGLLAIILVLEERDIASGVVLGLAIVNKLDAGMLAVAVAGSLVVVQRRFPTRTAMAAALTALPWFAFSLLYFGTVIPNSATSKLSDVRSETSDWSPLWIVRSLGEDLIAVAAIAGVVGLIVALLLPGIAGSARRGVLLIGGWSLLHFVAFSLVDLGDTYPWYRTVIYPGIAVVAAWLAVRVAELAAERSRQPRILWTLASVIVVMALIVGVRLDHVTDQFPWGRDPNAGTAIDMLRQQSGRYIDERAAPDDVVRTCFGWVAYEAIDQNIDELCPLNTQEPVAPPTWFNEIAIPVPESPPVLVGAEVVATFTTDFPEDGASYVYRATDR